MTYEEFERGYKNLCEAYSKKFSREQCRVYFDDIGPRVDLSQWGGIVRAWRRSSETFPKICELVVATSGQKQEAVEADPVLAWLNADCQVRECVDGLIPVLWPEGGVPAPILTMDEPARLGPGSELSLGCPRCRRYKDTVPRMKEYHGPITLRTSEEMDVRRKERLEIYGRAGR